MWRRLVATAPLAFRRAHSHTRWIHRRFSSGVGGGCDGVVNDFAHQLRGFNDHFTPRSSMYTLVERIFESVCTASGFQEIRLPCLEGFGTYQHSLGESSEVVSKELFRWNDHGKMVVLRPEGTANTMRALMDRTFHHWHSLSHEKLYYCGPMFRRESPQRGRLRQFQQFGCEYIGSSHYVSDVLSIYTAWLALERLQLSPYVQLCLNSTGSQADRERYRSELVDFLRPRRHLLSEISRSRLDNAIDSQSKAQGTPNLFRILDSKQPEDRRVVHGWDASEPLDPSLSDLDVKLLQESAPKPLESSSEETQQRFQRVCEGLEILGVRDFVVDPFLVRGLDYYGHTCFEFVESHGGNDGKVLGASSAVIAGGRYDGLASVLDGVRQQNKNQKRKKKKKKKKAPSLACVGWAAGIDRLVLMLEQQQQQLQEQQEQEESQQGALHDSIAHMNTFPPLCADAEIIDPSIDSSVPPVWRPSTSLVASELPSVAIVAIRSKNIATGNAGGHGSSDSSNVGDGLCPVSWAALQISGQIVRQKTPVTVTHHFLGSVSKQMKRIANANSDVMVFVGPDDIKEGVVRLKDTQSRVEYVVKVCDSNDVVGGDAALDFDSDYILGAVQAIGRFVCGGIQM